MSGTKLFWFLPIAFLLDGCIGPAVPKTCLDIAETGADGRAIRTASPPPVASGGPELCEGLALIRDRRGDEARTVLTRAYDMLPLLDRWLAQGGLAWSLTLDKQDDDALKLWDPAIAGAIKAGDRKRQGSFRLVRGSLYARAEQYAPALDDFSAAYAISSEPGGRSQAAYAALGIAVTTSNLELARNWYPKVTEAASAAGNLMLQSKAAEFYAQMLEEAGHSDEAASVYTNAVTVAKASGSKELQAEMLEYHGQARFVAGDYRSGERAYREAAELARQSGQADFAAQLDNSLRTCLMRYETGDACGAFLDAGKLDLAERAVTDVPPERRSWAAQACEVRVFVAKGDSGRARQRLETLVETTNSGWKCDQLKAMAKQIGIIVDPTPQSSAAPQRSLPPSVGGFYGERSDPDPNQRPPVYDGRCHLRPEA